MRQTKLPGLLIAVSAFVAAQTDPAGRVGRLNCVDCPVSFQPAGVTDWVDAGISRPLTTRDQVWVGDGGRAEIHVGSTALCLGSNTAFQFLNLDDQTVQFQLSEGTLAVRNPGRPLPPATVQQMGRNAPARNSPVRVEDMSRVQRIQPTVGAGPQQGARLANLSARPGEPDTQPPNPPGADNRPSGPPTGRQQPEQLERAAPPAQPNRPQAQGPPRHPPQQMQQAPVETQQPASRPTGAKGKPDKNDEKKYNEFARTPGIMTVV